MGVDRGLWPVAWPAMYLVVLPAPRATIRRMKRGTTAVLWGNHWPNKSFKSNKSKNKWLYLPSQMLGVSFHPLWTGVG